MFYLLKGDYSGRTHECRNAGVGFERLSGVKVTGLALKDIT